MNRITQCLHGKGTVSAMIRHRDAPLGEVPSQYLAFSGMDKPVVFWNLTNRCNLHCAHCYSRSGPHLESGGELTTVEAVGLIDDLSAMGVPLILLSGGEPLVRDDIWTLVARAREKGIKTALSTNGTLITAETARQIRKCGIEYVGISLDGANPATHDRFRNITGAFERAVAAFIHCRDAEIRCGVRVTFTRENFLELGDLIDLSVSLGASRFCLYWLVPSGRAMDSYQRLQVGKKEVEAALTLLYRRAQEIDPARMEFLTVDAPQDCIHLIRSMERDNSPDAREARTLLSSLRGGCSAGIRVANIDPWGNVYPCQFARSPEFLVGNIRKRPFSELWRDNGNPALLLFRGKNSIIDGKCRACEYFSLCGGGCRVRAHSESGDFSAPDPFCFVDQ